MASKYSQFFEDLNDSPILSQSTIADSDELNNTFSSANMFECADPFLNSSDFGKIGEKMMEVDIVPPLNLSSKTEKGEEEVCCEICQNLNQEQTMTESEGLQEVLLIYQPEFQSEQEIGDHEQERGNVESTERDDDTYSLFLQETETNTFDETTQQEADVSRTNFPAMEDNSNEWLFEKKNNPTKLKKKKYNTKAGKNCYFIFKKYDNLWKKELGPYKWKIFRDFTNRKTSFRNAVYYLIDNFANSLQKKLILHQILFQKELELKKGRTKMKEKNVGSFLEDIAKLRKRIESVP
jgi:hypothetical protein